MIPEEGQILTGPQFSEPVRVETVRADGPGSWGLLGVVGIPRSLIVTRLLRRSAPRNDSHLQGHCERSEAISVSGGAGIKRQIHTTRTPSR
jgi:hypothetical protein